MAVYRERFITGNDFYPLGSGSFNLSSANTYRGFYFVAPWAKTINNICIYNLTVTGTPTSAMRVQVFEVTSRYSATPSITSLESKTVTPTAAANDIGSWTTALTKGKVYAILCDNVHGTPASNYFSPFSVPASTISSPFLSGPASTNGTTLSSMGQSQISMRIKFSDNTYFGPGAIVTAYGYETTYSVYSAREVGMMWKIPFSCSVVGLGNMSGISVTGTPTGNVRLRLYTGNGTKTLQATTDDLYIVNSTQYATRGYFSSPIALTKNDYVNVVIGESTQSDTSSNKFNAQFAYIENNANSLAQFANESQVVYYDGSTWTGYPHYQIPGLGLLLENDNEFPSASGGGIILPRSVNGV